MDEPRNAKTPDIAIDESNLRQPKIESIERDKRKGWDHENCLKDGKDVSWAIFNQPVKERKLIYVKLPDGSFRFSPRPDANPLARRRQLTLPHTMLSKAGKVIGAGECETDKNGKITRADNFSGHYQPGEQNLIATKQNMENQGLSSDQARFEVVDRSGAVTKAV
jgi:hypothetical protein